MFGRFSNPYNKHLLAIVKEPDPVVFNRHSNSFKDTITNSVASFEIKGWKLNINIENKLRFLFTTNSISPIKVEEDDRRFVIYECCDTYYKNINIIMILEIGGMIWEIENLFLDT